MATLDLSQYGIKDVKKIIHNPSYEDLFKAETDPSLTGYEKGYLNDISTEVWDHLREKAVKELSDKTLYVVDVFCGANENTRIAVRFIMEVAWQAHFVTNMFIRPTEEELKDFKPNFFVFNASRLSLHSTSSSASRLSSTHGMAAK